MKDLNTKVMLLPEAGSILYTGLHKVDLDSIPNIDEYITKRKRNSDMLENC
jgi:hypothetical protein